MVGAHAYVIEYRAVDACRPPECRIDGRRTFGNATSDPAGAYVEVGDDKTELFAKRGLVLRAATDLSFTLPDGRAARVFDADLSSLEAGPFRARLEVRAGGALIVERELSGVTAPFEHTTDPNELGRDEKYFLHVREPLPDVPGPLAITLRNEGSGRLGIGAPVVLRRVEGRAPRQAVLVFFDAVPHPIFEQAYRGGTEATAWVAGWVRRGTLFSQAISPGQLTGSFVRRFFRGDYYRLDGDPSLAGQGFDETAPERAPGPIARLAEQGFVTEAIASNLYLSPVLSRIGFDRDYNIESTIELQIHPRVLARRFAREIESHREDDAVFVLWFANTHAPWREGREHAPPFRSRDGVDLSVLDPIWKNALDSFDALRSIVESASGAVAQRVWILATDHGHTFTVGSRARPWRLTREAVEDGHMHCCLSTEQEAKTWLAVIEEGAPPKAGAVDQPISTLSAWREIEERLGVDLELPKTSAFAKVSDRAAFDDGLLVSVGNSGSLFARRGPMTYHAYQPSPTLAPAWELGTKLAPLLFGSAEPDGDIPAEELYDVASDPLETHDLAQSRFDELLAMRARMTDWLAEYADGPEHERYEYRLDFGRPVEIAIRAPRSFELAVDGQANPENLRGTVFHFREGEEPLGVVDLGGELVSRGLVVRCAASGLPLGSIDTAHRRFNLALARTNCPFEGGQSQPSEGEVAFEARRIDRKGPTPASGRLGTPELRRALMRWGYVRDK